MRILFAGSPAIAVPSLKALAGLEAEGKGVVLAGVLTNPDSRRGRHACYEPTEISAAVSEIDAIRKEKSLPPVPQLKFVKLGAAARAEVASLSPDLLVSFAYGHIFGPRFLALFPLGGINIHPSLLPKYRGASPIPAVILAREKETGICIQKLALEMDSGSILAEERLSLSGRETALSLGETAGKKAAVLLSDIMRGFDEFSARAREQKGEPGYCPQIKKEDGLIDWNKSAVEIDAQIRAYTPWPLSFTTRGKDTLFILEAQPFDLASRAASFPRAAPGTVLAADKNSGILIQTGDGVLSVLRLQWQAKKPLDRKAFCNGARDFAGTKFAS